MGWLLVVTEVEQCVQRGECVCSAHRSRIVHTVDREVNKCTHYTRINIGLFALLWQIVDLPLEASY